LKTTYNYDNLANHGVVQSEADEVLRSTVDVGFELQPSRRGNPRTMVVGFTAGARLLELGIEFFMNEDRVHVFHANDATKYYQQLFANEIKT
jgi:uncharacterized DUF497 family protein